MRFSPITIERFQKTRLKGLTFRPHALGMGGCFEKGQFVVLGLRCQDGLIQEARFESFNCISAIAAADWVCEQLVGASADGALAIELETIVAELGGLPPSRLFCAGLARQAMTVAVAAAQKKGIL